MSFLDLSGTVFCARCRYYDFDNRICTYFSRFAYGAVLCAQRRRHCEAFRGHFDEWDKRIGH